MRDATDTAENRASPMHMYMSIQPRGMHLADHRLTGDADPMVGPLEILPENAGARKGRLSIFRVMICVPESGRRRDHVSIRGLKEVETRYGREPIKVILAQKP